MLTGYDVVLCRQCGCAYADNIPAQDVFDAYYRDLSKYEYHQRDGAVTESDKQRFAAITTLIQPYLTHQARILDVGCATGALLAELKRRGFANVHGLDPSPVCAEAARRFFDIPVTVGSLADARTDKPFDVVIMVGVLEHIRELTPMLARVRSLLRPGGLAFMEVPNVLQFHKVRQAPFQQLSVEHINFFSPASLQNLMSCHGFDAVAVSQSIRDFADGIKDPVASGVFRLRDDACAGTWRKDETTALGLRQYLEQSQEMEAQERRKLDELIASGEPVIVWGTGTQTQRMLATGNLGKTNLRAFVDSNVKYHGKNLHGVPILRPMN